MAIMSESCVSKETHCYQTLSLKFNFFSCKISLQVVENDLVTARQADRSLGSQDLSRY